MALHCPAGLDCSADKSSRMAASIPPVLVLGVLAVGGRLYSRHLTGQGGNSSDYTVIAGLLVSASLTGMILYSLRFGIGQHVTLVPPEHVERLLITLYIGCVLYAVAITLIKVSILLLYRSLFPTRDIKLATTMIGAISIAWGTETALVGIFSCKPVTAFWDISATEKKCINTTAFFIANSAVHVVLDMVILTLPVRKVWALRMPRQKKIVVSFMFLLGGFICVIGILRLFFLATLKMSDPTYSLTDTYLWSSIEANVGIICACLPTLRPLFMKFFPGRGFESQTATKTPVYSTHSNGTRWPRSRQRTGSFTRLPDYGLENLSPLEDGKMAVIINCELAQARKAGSRN